MGGCRAGSREGKEAKGRQGKGDGLSAWGGGWGGGFSLDRCRWGVHQLSRYPAPFSREGNTNGRWCVLFLSCRECLHSKKRLRTLRSTIHFSHLSGLTEARDARGHVPTCKKCRRIRGRKSSRVRAHGGNSSSHMAILARDLCGQDIPLPPAAFALQKYTPSLSSHLYVTFMCLHLPTDPRSPLSRCVGCVWKEIDSTCVRNKTTRKAGYATRRRQM